MIKRFFILIFLLLSFHEKTIAQEKRYKIHTVAFYNVENLFDTINDVNKNDEASPIMEIEKGRSDIYSKKLLNLSRVKIGRAHV